MSVLNLKADNELLLILTGTHTQRLTDLCVCVLTPPSVALVDNQTRLSVAFHSDIKREKRLEAPANVHVHYENALKVLEKLK